MQEIIIVAGPNGAGKTSFARQYLPAKQEGLFYVNADELAQDIRELQAGTTQMSLDARAGRAMLSLIDQLVADEREFMLETTLATRSYAAKIPVWQGVGYYVSLIYLRLQNVEMSVERVRRRVLAGGHNIPEPVIRRRFARSEQYLEQIYKPIVNDWSVWDSVEGDFNLVATSDDL